VINGYRSIDQVNSVSGNFPVTGAEGFEPRSGRWSELPKLAVELSRITLLTMKSGALIGLGGADGRTQVSAVQIFDAESSNWQQVAPMNQSVGSVRGAVLNDGRVVVIGLVPTTSGRGSGSTTVGGEVYDPYTNLWLPISVQTSLSVQLSTKLAGGQILAVGATSPSITDAGDGLRAAVWDPNGFPPLPGADGPLASGLLAELAAGVAAILLFVLAAAHLRGFAPRVSRK